MLFGKNDELDLKVGTKEISNKDIKKIKSKFNELVDDIFDNYNLYTEQDRARVNEELLKLTSLNDVLNKYDKKEESKNLISYIKEWFKNATGTK